MNMISRPNAVQTFVKRKYLIAFGLVAVLVALLGWRGDFRELSRIAEFQPPLILAVILATAMLVLSSSWRWATVLKGLHPDFRAAPMAYVRVVLLGVTLGQIVPQDVSSPARAV